MSQPGRSPGSFMPNQSSQSSTNNFYSAAAAAAAADLPPPPRPRMRRVESSSSEDIPLQLAKARSPTQQHHPQFPPPQPPAPGYATAHSNTSATSLQNFSRPTPSPLSSAAAAARSVAGSYEQQQQQQQQQQQLRNASPLSLSSNRPGHARKHSETAGSFAPTLPSISTSNLSSHATMSQQSPLQRQSPVQRELSASHIAAQAAVLSHQQSQQMLQHSRQRSLTAPTGEAQENLHPPKRTSGPLGPPALSLTEASAPRESGFGSLGYHNGLLGSNAASAAANAAFPRSGQTSPISQLPPQPPPPPPPLPEKKPEKSSKVKLFSRPGKIGTKGEPKDKPLPSPSKIGSALSALQRGNFSTTSLETHSFYNISNGSSATIRPGDAQPVEKEGKEKKHHFLSRQRHKTKDKDDYHTQLSSAASNSRPTDPNAPTSLYNFNLPSSPGPSSSTFKNISGLGHGGRTRKKEDKTDFHVHDSIGSVNDWTGPGSLGSASVPMFLEPIDSAKYGLNSMAMDDAFPYLKSKLLVIFEGEDLRLPVEDFNRIVLLHIQYCIHRRNPNQLLDDLRELLWTGFSSLDHNLRRHSEDRLIPNLVDLWLHVFTGVLPYMQAVFLPLDMEFAGAGSLMTPDQARDFFGGVITQPTPTDTPPTGPISLAPASAVLDVRRLVLTAYRDVVILPRYDKLKAIFSRLSLEFLPGLASPIPDVSASPSADSVHSSFPFSAPPASQRPGTAMSLDPSTASYNSTSTTLLGDLAAGGAGGGGGGGGSGTRSRGLSNVSFASSSGAHSSSNDGGGLRPPNKLHGGGGMGGGNSTSVLREQNVEDSKYVTDMVGRMLQCMSVLAGASGTGAGDEGTKMVEELGRLLKLNWLGRGRTGRNRRGIVGGRVARRATEGSLREGIEVI